MVVELIESIPPRKIQSMRFQPKACPTVMPSVIMHVMMMQAAMTCDEPMRRIFLMEKSSPKEKSRKITPMSAHVCTSARSSTDMV